MQRQSLGSPSTKHHIHGGGLQKDDARLTELQPSSSSSSSSSSSTSSPTVYDDDDSKTTKPRRFSLSSSPSLSSSLTSYSTPEKLIHLIPLLTLFCFLVLYLSSHTPSPLDLAQFQGSKRPLNQIDSGKGEDVSRFIELRRGDFLAIGSLRNLQEIEKQAPISRPHRKIADF